MKIKRFISLIILITSATVLLSGCGSFNGGKNTQDTDLNEKERFQENYFDVFDTVIAVIAYCDSQEEFNEFSNTLHNELQTYHKLFDIYRTYEGINNAKTINQKAGMEPVKVDEELIDLIELSKEIYSLTDGRMNIAMGAVLSIWHEARELSLTSPDKAYIPDMEELREASDYCNIEDIVIDREAGTVFISDPKMSIDLGAIAKGYATERATKKLEEAGYGNFVISAGGNVRASGSKTDGSSWVIAVQNPDTSNETVYVDKVNLMDSSLVTSGVYQRYYEYKGNNYHHIIDPTTLMPENRFLSLSIITEDSGIADALSTAIFNMDHDDGYELIEGWDGVEALWVMPDGALVKSSGWESVID